MTKKPPGNQRAATRRRVILVVRDGWGYTEETAGNAIHMADTPNNDHYMASYPWTLLKCTGNAVGLPEGTQGGSEANLVWIDDKILPQHGEMRSPSHFLEQLRGSSKMPRLYHDTDGLCTGLLINLRQPLGVRLFHEVSPGWAFHFHFGNDPATDWSAGEERDRWVNL